MTLDAPRWDPKRPIAPFDRAGLLHYPGWTAVEWREAPPFHAVLRLKDQARGRSAAYFIWEDVATGQRYPMFMTDLAEVIGRCDISCGATEPMLWMIKKRGQNYGIALA